MATATATQNQTESQWELTRYAWRTDDTEALSVLAESEYRRVRSSVARNPFTSIETLEVLTGDLDYAVATFAQVALMPVAVMALKSMAKRGIISVQEANQGIIEIYREQADGGLAAERAEHQKSWKISEAEEEAAEEEVSVQARQYREYQEYRNSMHETWAARRAERIARKKEAKANGVHKVDNRVATKDPVHNFTPAHNFTPVSARPASYSQPSNAAWRARDEPQRNHPGFIRLPEPTAAEEEKAYGRVSRTLACGMWPSQLEVSATRARNQRLRAWGRAQGYELRTAGPINKKIRALYLSAFPLDSVPTARELYDAHLAGCEDCQSTSKKSLDKSELVRVVPIPSDAHHSDYCPLADGIGCPCLNKVSN
ncbi:hypothetical protein [Citricoccus nitrophenolicus]|uniref:hypothetical protein n=1 Tax=Citricoccus nitrophenolicus TaxID=863575 RepID=UPI0031ED77BE